MDKSTGKELKRSEKERRGSIHRSIGNPCLLRSSKGMYGTLDRMESHYISYIMKVDDIVDEIIIVTSLSHRCHYHKYLYIYPKVRFQLTIDS